MELSEFESKVRQFIIDIFYIENFPERVEKEKRQLDMQISLQEIINIYICYFHQSNQSQFARDIFFEIVEKFLEKNNLHFLSKIAFMYADSDPEHYNTINTKIQQLVSKSYA